MTSRTVPLRHLADVRVSNVDKKETADEIQVRLVNYTDVYHGDRIVPDLELMTATASKSQVKAFRLKAGDVLITKDSESASDIGVPAFIERTASDMVCGYHLAILRPRPKKIDGRFLYWAMNSDNIRGQMESAATGVTRFGLRRDIINQVKIRLPSDAMQHAIVNYLDTETARIDVLISKKQILIKLLEERRSNFVSEAVTMGLANNRESVDTRNRYIPRILKHWRLMRLRHVVEQIVDTLHKTAPVVDDGEYLVVRTSNVKNGRLILDGARYTDRASWLEWNHRSEPRPGDVLLTREAPAGEACLVPADTWLCIGQRMVLLRVRQTMASGEWVVHSIYSGPAQRFITDLSNATTVAHLNMSDIPDIPIAIPDLKEQQQLLVRIRSEVRRHEETVSKLKKQIDLLAERRQSLITAVVTGEMLVPEVGTLSSN